jgi:hypothetical protein
VDFLPRAAHLVLLLLLAVPVLAGTRLKTPDEAALKTFRLTSENVRKSAAVMQRLASAVARDPSLAESIQKNARRAKTLDEKAKALDGDPRVASALRAEGIGAREYVMVQMATAQASLVVAIEARGVQIDTADLREALNPANVTFLETHRVEMDELAQSQEELQKVSKGANREQGKQDEKR